MGANLLCSLFSFSLPSFLPISSSLSSSPSPPSLLCSPFILFPHHHFIHLVSHSHHCPCYSVFPPTLCLFLALLSLSVCLCLSHLTSDPSDSAFLPFTRSVQSEVDEVRGSRAGASPGACPGTRGTGQTAHLQQICVQHQSGGEEDHSGRQRPHCGHRGHPGLSGSLD